MIPVNVRPAFTACLVVAVGLLGCWPVANVLGEDSVPKWVLETKAAPWQARDSQGEYVFDDKLWIMGGWFSSYAAPPRDVWSSPDGRNWKLVQKPAPWIHSDLPMSLVFDERMWMMGGWYNGRLDGHSASNQVWSSTDGANWKQVSKAAGWTPRIAAASVTFKGKMWILGGTEDYYFGDESKPSRMMSGVRPTDSPGSRKPPRHLGLRAAPTRRPCSTTGSMPRRPPRPTHRVGLQPGCL